MSDRRTELIFQLRRALTTKRVPDWRAIVICSDLLGKLQDAPRS